MESSSRLTFSRFRTLMNLAVGVSLVMGLFASAPLLAAPDVTVFDLPNTTNYGSANGIRGYSVGTTSCNVGSTPLNWCTSSNIGSCAAGATTHDHPTIGQNLYRLKNGRMDQIGASWLKHGFTSLNNNTPGCGASACVSPPQGGAQLGVGCTDPYTSTLNGTRPMGRKSEVNATTGAFPFPVGGGGATTDVWNQRVAVAEADLEPPTNPVTTRYFVEGQYIAPDDAMAGNGLNNASYREVSISAGTFNLNLLGTTTRQKSAIEAWPVIDPSVEIFNVDVAGTPVQRFHVARKVTEVTPGALWHYEYAVHNMNADRAADKLSITFAGATTFSGVGFHDVNAHSNEPYDTADWPGVTSADTVEWLTPAFPASPQNANAIRWGTTYNFWFDANRPPTDIGSNVLRLFTAGSPTEVSFGTNTVIYGNGFEGP